MANLMPLPKMRFTNAGRPLVGGKVFFYVAGTTTPKTTFKDRTQATANTNPVILDSNGEADIWLEMGYYKVVLKDRNDVTVWTVDRVATDTGGLNVDDLANAVDSAEAAADVAVGAVSGSVNTFFAATKAAGDAIAAGLGNGATVITDEDEAATPAGVQTRRNVLGGALSAIVSFLKTSAIAWKHGGTGAVWRTLYARLMDLPVSVKDFGAVEDGATDDAAAIQAALNSGAKTVRAEGGVYAFGSQLSVPPYIIFEGDGKYATILNKTFNGDALVLGTGATLRCLQIDGNGGANTGRGVLINSGATNQTIDQCRIVDFSDYCVEFTAAGAGSGFQMPPGSELARTTAGDVAIKLPTDVSASPRHFAGVNASSSVLMDTAGADNTLISGCFARNIIFGAASAKVVCVGNRLATVGSNCIVQGVNQVFVGNDVAGGVEAGSSLTSSTISGNYPGPVIDNSLSRSNTIDNVYFDFTPVWLAASVNPSLGNGTLTGRLVRVNRLVKVSMYLTIGSTTTTGTGVWTFVLPASLSWMTASKLSIGSCYGLRSGVNFQVGVAISNTDPATFGVVLLSHAGGNNWGPTVPVTWASGDYVRMDVEFELA